MQQIAKCGQISGISCHNKNITLNFIYLYFKVWKVECCPEQRTEVGYGGDFPPRLDLFHRNCTSLGHFQTENCVTLFLTLEINPRCMCVKSSKCLTPFRYMTKVAVVVPFSCHCDPYQSATICFNQNFARAEQMGCRYHYLSAKKCRGVQMVTQSVKVNVNNCGDLCMVNLHSIKSCISLTATISVHNLLALVT